jgi:uncharacterized protein (TIGR03437 family)
VTIDAGPYGGTRTLPVLAVAAALPNQPPAPPAPKPQPQPPVTVTSLGNAASPWAGPVTPGSLATLKGSRLTGNNVAATFDGLPAKMLYTSESQINLQVPAELGARPRALLVVTVDGTSSAPQSVELASVAPAIFPNGILNENGVPNGPNSPARAGSIIAFWTTALTPAVGQTSVTVRIHDRDGLLPVYAGAAPGLTGVQQVNVLVPEDLPAMTTELAVCATDTAGRRVCSLPVDLALTR